MRYLPNLILQIDLLWVKNLPKGVIVNYMPLKVSKKGGGTKSRSFNQVVGEFKRKGDSEQVAKAKAGKIQALQEGTYKGKKKRR